MSCCNNIVKIRVVKGDARKLFVVNEPTLPSGWNIAKMNIQIGNLMKSYPEPTFPVVVSLTPAESLSLETGINEVAVLLFNGEAIATSLPQTAILNKNLQVIAEPQKVQQ